jgi:uncharacterized protein YbcI
MTVTDRSPAGSRSSAISNLAIRLLSRYAGRGPERTRTYFNDDMVTIVMRDLLTKPESNLLENGQADLVLRTRTTFQQLMSEELVAGVEEITQREVIAFMSANHVDPDIAVETFILAPSAGGGARVDDADDALGGS